MEKINRQRKRCAIQIISQKNPHLKIAEIANIVGTSKMTVSRWKNKSTFTDKKRKRKSKMTKDIKNFLLKNATNKFTGINNASSRRLSYKIRKKFKISISHETTNTWLNKLLKKPIKAKKTFYLRKKDKTKRMEFYDMIKKNEIKGKDIFFTDEKRFILNPPLNKQTNQIRLNNEGLTEYQSGEGNLFEKIHRPQEKFPKGIMVAGGLSRNGVGRLIFVTGTMTSFSYLQALEFYKNDIRRLGENLYLQQDNAPCHVGKKSLKFIKENFKNYLEFWPANSPDLSPIEELWGIVEEKLNCYSFKTLEEMTKKLLWVWNRIPRTICKNLVDSFDKKIELLALKNGERVNKRKHLKNNKKNSNYSWRNTYDNDTTFNIVYNEKVLEKMQKIKIKSLNKQLKGIKDSFAEEKKRYSTKNKKLLKEESKELYDFFLNQEKEMVKTYEEKIKKKEEEIKVFNELKGRELFDKFSLEEKINNIKLNNKIKGINSNLSTNINSDN